MLFRSIKEVKLLGREEGILAGYGRHNAAVSRMERLHSTFEMMPRLWIEVLAVAGLATLVLTMLASGRSAAAVVPTLALFGAAAFRLMPSASRVITALQNLRYGLPIVNTIREELQLAPTGAPGGAGAQQRVAALTGEIRLVNVGYEIGRAHV